MKRLLALLGAIAVVLVGFAVAPSSSEAYVGQSFVQVGGDLTGPAKTILENPTFLEEAYGEAAAAGERTAFLDMLSSAGLLPELSAVLPWVGAGAVATAVVCNFIIDCADIFGLGSDPALTEKWTWTRVAKPQIYTAAGISVWLNSGLYYAPPQATIEDWEEVCGHSAGSLHVPAEAEALVKGTTEMYCPPVTPGTTTMPLRSGSANRGLEFTGSSEPDGSGSLYSGSGYCPIGGASCAAAPPENWGETTSTCLDEPQKCGATSEQRDHIGQKIASAIPGSGVGDPYVTTTTIPSCDEVTWGACKAAIEEAELEPVREDLDWEEVTTTTPDEVVELQPAKSTEVEKGTAVKVITNPPEEGMPIVIPEPEDNETYSHYAARLNPALSPSRVDVGEAFIDPAVGPNAVIRADPVFGTKFAPGTEQDVEVQTNPSTAPPPTGGGCNATLSAIDIGPLNQPLGSRFPFGVFAFFVGWIGEWEGASGAPHWKVTLVPTGVLGSDGLYIEIELSTMEAVAEVVRIAFLFASFVGLLWFLGTSAMRLQGDDS